MRHRMFIAMAIAGALIFVSLAAGAPTTKAVKFAATLTVAQEKQPSPKGTRAGETGKFSATLTGTTLKWTLTWKNLTGPATQAHIHEGKRGISGNVLVALCPPGCKSPLTGKAVLTPAQVKLLKSGGTYVNVHTAKNFNGEIRGQITKLS